MSELGDHLPPVLGDPRLTILGLLLETHAGVRSAYVAELEDHGISGSAFEVLIRLARSPHHRLRMTDLAGQSTLSNSGLTRVIDRLLARGHVERVRHERDRRVYYAVLTRSGLDQVLLVLPSHLDTVDELITGVLSAEELRAFEATLRKIRAVANPEADPDLSPAAT